VTGDKIRVLVVEDSLTVRRKIVEVLSADSEFQVVAEADDGKRAIEMCQQLRPDVVTMDMVLPVMSGLTATEYIMAYCPTPILIVSSSTNRGELFKTYEALAAGALDILEKPRGDEADGCWEQTLKSTVRLISRIRVITHPRARLGAGLSRAPLDAPRALRNSASDIIGLGASTGGPAAILEVLRAIPAGFSAVILLVIHISEPFGSAFAEWLDGETGHRVSYPKNGAQISAYAGRVVMAPPDRHLVVRNGCLYLNSDPERHSCRPSVDVLFESLAREHGSSVVACLLTGMGRDGAAGMLAIRRAGGLTIAQDEATSVVFGMPREAILLNAVDRVLPLPEIGPTISTFVRAAQ
jgi:two-component system, chemotaxis family, protein-glutamate methylesterase/glutaminase